jgi:hypothetical protein
LTNSVSLFFDKLDVAIKGQTRCRVTRSSYPGVKVTMAISTPKGLQSLPLRRSETPLGFLWLMVAFSPG